MQPMKLSAIAVIMIGVVIALFAFLTWPSAPSSPQLDSAETTPGVSVPSILLPFAILAILIGAGMWLYGGRGSIKTRNPAVRN